MAEEFRTVAGRGRAVRKVRGSRFIGYAAPAADIETAESVVEVVNADHQDASHIVPAYRVRAEPMWEYSDDDGEPGGSAGRPILSVLRGEALENVVVAVVRYFGGTELGVGGLARAYSQTAGDAIRDANVIQRTPHERFTVVLDYDDSGTVRSVLESSGVEFEATYAEQVSIEVRVQVNDAEPLRDRLRSATSGRVEIERGL